MNALELKHVSKTYKDFHLDDLSLTLPGGCILGLVGENGAGKSTTIKMILNIIHKDGGEITILGKDSVKDSLNIKEDVGVVLDDNGIPGALNAKKLDKIMKAIFKKWDSEYYFQLLNRLKVPVKKSYGEFSRGMKMKMGIAIALSHAPSLLILDEATNGLDPIAREEVMELLFDFTRDESHSILISSHIVSDLEKICDYIAFLHKGKLLLMEEKDVLLEEYGIVHMKESDLSAISKEAVIGKKVSPYGAEVLVRKDKVPAGFTVSPVSIEDLFVFMIKEAV